MPLARLPAEVSEDKFHGASAVLGTKHLSPNAFKWFPRAGKMWVLGRDDDPFPFWSLPHMEALLGGISADGGNPGCNKPFGELSVHGVCGLQSLVLVTLAPLIGQGLCLSCHIQTHSNQHISTWSLCTQPWGASPELSLESWTLKLSNPMSWGSNKTILAATKAWGIPQGERKDPGCWVNEGTRPPLSPGRYRARAAPCVCYWGHCSSCYACYYFIYFFFFNLPFPLNSSLCLKATGAGVWMDWRASSTNDRQKFNPE